MNKKWYAKIKADDKENGKIIKLGIKKCIEDEKIEFSVISQDTDEKHAHEKNFALAISDIAKLWGEWNSFEWIE